MRVENRIAELRKERGITLHGLAELTGQHFTTVARHQSGSIARVPRHKLEQYARVLECKLMDLFLDSSMLPGGGGGNTE